ncbi:unnamed protein product, partial [marine sediment metagenome]
FSTPTVAVAVILFVLIAFPFYLPIAVVQYY